MAIFETSKLKGKIVEVFGSQRDFAKAVNKSQAFVSGVLNGKAYLEQRDIVLWASVLGISESEFGPYFFTRIVHESEPVA